MLTLHDSNFKCRVIEKARMILVSLKGTGVYNSRGYGLHAGKKILGSS